LIVLRRKGITFAQWPCNFGNEKSYHLHQFGKSGSNINHIFASSIEEKPKKGIICTAHMVQTSEKFTTFAAAIGPELPTSHRPACKH
jgi:hypothetical protein